MVGENIRLPVVEVPTGRLEGTLVAPLSLAAAPRYGTLDEDIMRGIIRGMTDGGSNVEFVAGAVSGT